MQFQILGQPKESTIADELIVVNASSNEERFDPLSFDIVVFRNEWLVCADALEILTELLDRSTVQMVR
jgi:hypothetical protein